MNDQRKKGHFVQLTPDESKFETRLFWRLFAGVLVTGGVFAAVMMFSGDGDLRARARIAHLVTWAAWAGWPWFFRTCLSKIAATGLTILVATGPFVNVLAFLATGGASTGRGLVLSLEPWNLFGLAINSGVLASAVYIAWLHRSDILGRLR